MGLSRDVRGDPLDGVEASRLTDGGHQVPRYLLLLVPGRLHRRPGADGLRHHGSARESRLHEFDISRAFGDARALRDGLVGRGRHRRVVAPVNGRRYGGARADHRGVACLSLPTRHEPDERDECSRPRRGVIGGSVLAFGALSGEPGVSSRLGERCLPPFRARVGPRRRTTRRPCAPSDDLAKRRPRARRLPDHKTGGSSRCTRRGFPGERATIKV